MLKNSQSRSQQAAEFGEKHFRGQAHPQRPADPTRTQLTHISPMSFLGSSISAILGVRTSTASVSAFVVPAIAGDRLLEMPRSLTVLLCLAAAYALCVVLPTYIVNLRMWLFTRVNGDDGIQLPNDSLGVDGKEFKRLYSHRAARLRSKQQGVGLSDLFWYFLSPGAHIHQEHVETADPRYALVSSLTRKLCAMSADKLAALGSKHAEELLSADSVGDRTLTRLR